MKTRIPLVRYCQKKLSKVVGKKDIKVEWPYRGLSIWGECSNLLHSIPDVEGSTKDMSRPKLLKVHPDILLVIIQHILLQTQMNTAPTYELLLRCSTYVLDLLVCDLN